MKPSAKILFSILIIIGCVIAYSVADAGKAAPKKPSKNTLTDAVPAEVAYIIDGDTFAAKVIVSDKVTISVRVRMMQIDAPELHGECDAEIKHAFAARDRLGQLLPIGSRITLSNVKDDKYLGRIDAYVENASGDDVGDTMVKEKMARPYSGGKRVPWCGPNGEFAY
ncbi:MAG: thermonuclease family protein [Proteobacteria bacterium]|nr:thermonuclease family protein [Pseudomonadota bacterium]